jgi:hypothetical protein
MVFLLRMTFVAVIVRYYLICSRCHRYLTQETQQHRNGQPFWDPSAIPSGFSANLPDPLRVKPTGLQPHQVGVYEDFGEFLYWVIAM